MKYHSCIPSYSKGAVAFRAATTSSFFRIQVHPVLHLPLQGAAAVHAQSFSQGSGSHRQEQDVQILHYSDSFVNTIILLLL